MKYIMTLALFVCGVAVAQDVPDAVATPVPWNNVMITLIVTSALGLLSLIVQKIPGKSGEVVKWIIDLLSANVKHK